MAESRPSDTPENVLTPIALSEELFGVEESAHGKNDGGGRRDDQEAVFIRQHPPTHIPHLKDFVDTLERVAVPLALADPQPYDNVLACFVSWSPSGVTADVTGGQTRSNASDLRELLRTEFQYDVREVRLQPTPSRDSSAGVTAPPLSRSPASLEFVDQVSAHIRDVSRRRLLGPASPPTGKRTGGNGSLFILHYDGPSGFRKEDRRGVWFGRAASGYGAVEWDMVSSCVRQAAAECDVLLILECDFSSAVVRQDVPWSRRCEIISAAPRPRDDTSPPQKSLTSAITEVLRGSIGDAKTAMQLSWLLSDSATFGNARWTRLGSSSDASNSKSSILLQPLSSDANSTAQLLRASLASPLSRIDAFEKTTGLRVLISVRFTNPSASSPTSLGDWLRWPSSSKPTIDSKLHERLQTLIKCHTLHSGTPAAHSIISIPLWLWTCLSPTPNPAWTFLGLANSDENLLLPHLIPEKPPAYTTSTSTSNNNNNNNNNADKPTTTTTYTSISQKSTFQLFRTSTSLLRSQFSTVLADAQARYAKDSSSSTTKDGKSPLADLSAFSTPPMRTVSDLARVIDSQNSQFSTFRSKRHGLYHAMSVACTPLEKVGEVLSGTASEAGVPAAQTIFAAVARLISAARDVSEAYDAIEALFRTLADFTDRLRLYVSGGRMSPELHGKVVEVLAAVFGVFVLATEEVRRGRVKSYFRRLLERESPVQEAVENLRRLTRSEDMLVGAETNAVVKKQLSNQERLYEMVALLNVDLQSMRVETRQAILSASSGGGGGGGGAASAAGGAGGPGGTGKSVFTREQLLESNSHRLKAILRPTAYAEDIYLGLDRTRTPGTGDWILEDPSLKSWLAGEIRFLWVCGNPGTGKSYLTSRLVSWGLELMESREKTTHMLGYFFFRQTNPETRSVVQALRNVAFQLSEQDVFYGKQVLLELASGDEVKTVASAFRKLFVDPCKPDRWKRHIYVFLDGLDEADEAEVREFLPLLSELSRQPEGGTRVQVCLVGRTLLTETVMAELEGDTSSNTNPGSAGGGESALVRALHVTANRNGADIVSYIEQGVSAARIMRRQSREFTREVVEVMTRQVDGLFVLAEFMLRELKEINRKDDIIPSLRGFPQEINGMLRKAVLGFSVSLKQHPKDAADLNEMLSWVAVAQMSLTLEQLRCVLALQPHGAPEYDFLEEMLRVQFSCFFTLQRADGLSTADLVGYYNASSNPHDTFVTFYHQSVREFFVGDESTGLRASESSPAIGFDVGEAQLHVLRTCLRIFTDAEWFRLGAEEGIALQRYAAWYWQEHLEVIDQKSLPADQKAEIGRQLVRMLTDQVVVLTWTNLFEESLDIWTDGNIDCVKQWLSDPDVVSGLTAEGKAWAAEASRSSPRLLEPMGRIFARAWLERGFELYMPTLFCFGVVQCIALMSEPESASAGGATDGSKGTVLWSYSEYHWEDVTLETRVAKAAAWALKTGVVAPETETPQQTGHRYRRVGSTLLNLGLHAEAYAFFERALAADGDVAENCGRMGLCRAMSGDWTDALRLHLRAQNADAVNAINAVGSGSGSGSPTTADPSNTAPVSPTDSIRETRARSNAKWRLYKNLCQIAECHNRLGHVEQALTHAREAMSSEFAREHPPFEPEAAFVRILAENGRVEDLMSLVHELDSKTHSLVSSSSSSTTNKAFSQGGRVGGMEFLGGVTMSRLVAFLLHQVPDRAVRSWLPQAAARTGESDMLADRYGDAADLAGGQGQGQGQSSQLNDPWKERYLRNSLGKVYLCAGQLEQAIAVHEEVCLAADFFVHVAGTGTGAGGGIGSGGGSRGGWGGGSLAVRAEFMTSFRQLARAYALQVLRLVDHDEIRVVAAAPSGAGGGVGVGGGELRDGRRRLRELEQNHWLEKLERLMAQQELFRGRLDAPLQLAGLEFNEASVYLILLRRRVRRSQGDHDTSSSSSNSGGGSGDNNGDNNAIPAWRTMAAARIKECLDLLEDEEPQNDIVAIRNLQRTLLAAGDEENACALWQSTRQPAVAVSSSTAAATMRTPAGGSHLTSSTPAPPPLTSSPGPGTPEHHHRTPSPGSPSPRRRGRALALTRVFFHGGGGVDEWRSGTTPVACDSCLRMLAPDEELAVCKLCVDARFCGTCLVVVRDGLRKEEQIGGGSGGGEGEFSRGYLCSAAHEWMVVPPLDRELRAGEILVGKDKVVPLDEWKASLRLMWGVGRLASSGGGGGGAKGGGGGHDDVGHDRRGSAGQQQRGGLGISLQWDG